MGKIFTAGPRALPLIGGADVADVIEGIEATLSDTEAIIGTVVDQESITGTLAICDDDLEAGAITSFASVTPVLEVGDTATTPSFTAAYTSTPTAASVVGCATTRVPPRPVRCGFGPRRRTHAPMQVTYHEAPKRERGLVDGGPTPDRGAGPWLTR